MTGVEVEVVVEDVEEGVGRGKKLEIGLVRDAVFSTGGFGAKDGASSVGMNMVEVDDIAIHHSSRSSQGKGEVGRGAQVAEEE
jgi:hypothetical protein